MAGPWDSPKELNLNKLPNELPDIWIVSRVGTSAKQLLSHNQKPINIFIVVGQISGMKEN
jgi:hypothetical protein